MSVSPQAIQALLALSGKGANLLGLQGAGQGLGNAASGLGIYGGLQQGGIYGDLSALASAGKLTGNLAKNATLNTDAGDIFDGLGIYSGLQQGGISGYGSAAADTAKLAGSLSGNTALSAIGGDIAAPLALYDFGKNWQSGDTGGDALRGAEAGASVGSIVPGIGNLIGGLVGGAAGALSSAFGGGKHDPETTALQGLIPQYQSAVAANPQAAQSALSSLSPQDAFETLAGAFDAKNNTPGHSQPIEQTFGRMQEGAFLDDIAGQINSGYTSGTVKPGESASDIYSSVVSPWISSQTGGQGILGPSNGEGGILTGALQDLVGAYTSGNLTNTTPIGISGQQDSSLPSFAGLTPQMAAAAAANKPVVAPPAQQFSAQDLQGMANGVTPEAAFTQAAQQHAATGGSMRKVYYDDGGSFLDEDLSSSDILGGAGSGGLNLDNIFSNVTPSFDTGFSAYNDPAGFSDIAAQTGGLSPSSTSGGSSASSGKGLTGLLQGLGLSASTAGTLASLGVTAASLAPIIASLTGGTKGATPAALPAQYQGAIAPVSTPNMTRTQNPNMQTMSPAQWLHYGEMPEQQFYQNNQLPPTSMSSPDAQAGVQPGSTSLPPGLLAALAQTQGQGAAATAPASPPQQVQPINPLQIAQRPVMAHGGPVYMSQSPYQSATSSHVHGPGDGTSDDINAKLSDGEYVTDAHTVSLLGNGSNEAGAKALDAMRENVRKHAGKTLARGKQPMHARTPEQYMSAE